ncbi:hypothetical protein Pcinc_012443 [Petrolisthes cinctipes]|uniref:Uncharacterized protein n=1 Tax=Petrolisthes cinctipes TaxID=88211 RepID=A0AAE1FZA5_PETCI|nr:hypothetical protein Pcinc_012443 [Petrolisthes cinctipes]
MTGGETGGDLEGRKKETRTDERRDKAVISINRLRIYINLKTVSKELQGMEAGWVMKGEVCPGGKNESALIFRAASWGASTRTYTMTGSGSGYGSALRENLLLLISMVRFETT